METFERSAPEFGVIFWLLTVGDQVAVQKAVVVIVGRSEHDAGAVEIQTELLGLFFEPPVAEIHVEPIGRLKSTHIKI